MTLVKMLNKFIMGHIVLSSIRVALIVERFLSLQNCVTEKLDAAWIRT
jgi:hypothetical protein